MAEHQKLKKLKIRTGLFFIVVFLISVGCGHVIQRSEENKEKLKASYMADSVVRHIGSELSRYLENSEFLKNIIASGYEINASEFADLSYLMKENKEVIEAYELAPDGIVTQIYPLSGNEEAMGMNMLELPERKREATLAKDSGEYTIAGPYELKQGGTGALLFDPVYVKNENGKQEFWGFSILVLDWEKFVENLNLGDLEEKSYHFRIWKYNQNHQKVSIIQGGDYDFTDALDVACSVPNDTWHIEIVPNNGWTTVGERVVGILIGLAVSVVLTLAYWQNKMKRYRESVYARKIERAAKKAEAANEAKTRFLFSMSHDIRTPMNAIIGYSDLLEKNIDQKEVALGYVKKIKSSNSMLLSLINYTLEMARIESGVAKLKEESGDLQKLVDVLKSVSEPQILQKNLQFTWNLNVKHPYIVCDITKLREIIINIVSNAIKYTPNGGKVSLDIDELPEEKEGYARYCFQVTDNGIGMSEDYLPHIFEEFSREHTSTETKIMGAGLGLPIVKSLVDLMGGEISVKSKLGEGSQFSIELSFQIAEQEEIRQKQDQTLEKEGFDFSDKRILLVEDNDLNAEIAMTILKDCGLTVDRVKDGVDCLKILEEKPVKYYEAILMDIQMPIMNGYETTEHIRKKTDENAQIPIIAMTANAFEEDRQRAFQAGMDDHVAKPIDVAVLMRTLEKHLQDVDK